ncbi:MAG: ATP-binding protein [Alphaproteobacteria bacterium]
MAMRRVGRRSTEKGMVRALRTRKREVSPAPGDPAEDTGEHLRPSIVHGLVADAWPVYVADLSGSLLFANAAYQELLRDATRTSDSGPAGSEGRLLSPGALEQVRHEQGPIELDESIECGLTMRPFRSRHFPIRDDDGNLVAVGGVYRDATREHALAQRAAHIQERFDDITRLVSDWVWEVDQDFKFTYVSARVMEVFGVHPRLLLGSNLFDLGVFTDTNGEVPDRSIRSPFRDKVFRVVGADGRARLCRLSGMPIFEATSGVFIGYRGTGNDITAQVDAEERASRAQLRLAEAIESSSEAFALFDRNNRLVICNGKFREYHPAISDLLVPGAAYEDLIRAGAERGQFADAAGRTEEWVAQELERQRDPQGATEQRLADGRWLKVSDRRTEDGSTVCLRTDITELKQREEALRRAEAISRAARETAELANRAKTEFLANMSHELRTPLNAIIGFSEIIMGEMFGPIGAEQYKEYMKDIHESGTHLYNLINDILDVSKAEAGKLELSEIEIDIADAVARCIRLVKERAERADVGLEVEVPERLPKLYADERKIKQILLNLLSNAIKFTPTGGKVSISAGIEPDGWLRFAITDTGIGIADKDMADVMAPFGQVDSTLARRYEGTGLGLPLTKALVDLHGGELDLQSEINVGTTVIVRLPKDRLRPA